MFAVPATSWLQHTETSQRRVWLALRDKAKPPGFLPGTDRPVTGPTGNYALGSGRSRIGRTVPGPSGSMLQATQLPPDIRQRKLRGTKPKSTSGSKGSQRVSPVPRHPPEGPGPSRPAAPCSRWTAWSHCAALRLAARRIASSNVHPRVLHDSVNALARFIQGLFILSSRWRVRSW